MFTGLIERTGVVAAIASHADGTRIEIDSPGWPPDPQIGESIAVDGCCLTLVAADGDRRRFDVVPQTLSLTTLGRWAMGRRVNLERSATLATLLGGHLVQGHVDGVGRVERVVGTGGERRVRISAPEAVARLVVPQGSIAVNGVSLTIAEAAEGRSPRAGAVGGSGDGRDAGPRDGGFGGAEFTVALIPETLARTNLGALREGDEVNLEADAIAKLVDASVRRAMARAGAERQGG